MNGALINLEPKQLNAQNGELLAAQNLIGGLRAIQATFFPADCILITTLSNFAIYFKQDTHAYSSNKKFAKTAYKFSFPYSLITCWKITATPF